MTALIIIGFILAILAWAATGILETDDDGVEGVKYLLTGLLFLVGILMLWAGAKKTAYISALNEGNPYHKEYLYKQTSDSTQILYDSLYIKIDDR